MRERTISTIEKLFQVYQRGISSFPLYFYSIHLPLPFPNCYIYVWEEKISFNPLFALSKVSIKLSPLCSFKKKGSLFFLLFIQCGRNYFEILICQFGLKKGCVINFSEFRKVCISSTFFVYKLTVYFAFSHPTHTPPSLFRQHYFTE